MTEARCMEETKVHRRDERADKRAGGMVLSTRRPTRATPDHTYTPWVRLSDRCRHSLWERHKARANTHVTPHHPTTSVVVIITCTGIQILPIHAFTHTHAHTYTHTLCSSLCANLLHLSPARLVRSWVIPVTDVLPHFGRTRVGQYLQNVRSVTGGTLTT